MSRRSGSFEKYNRLVPPRRPNILETSKRRGEYNVPESRKYIEVKKEKVKFIGKLLMESGMVEALREPVLNKRKRVTSSGYNFKSKLAKRTKETAPEASKFKLNMNSSKKHNINVAGNFPTSTGGSKVSMNIWRQTIAVQNSKKSRVSQAEKISSYQETEEQVQSGNPKKQWLKSKVIYPQGPRNTTFISQETSSDDEEWLDHCPLIQRLAYMKTIKASAHEEGYENQTLLKRKQASQDHDRQESFRAEHCAIEILSPKKWPAFTGAGNGIEKDSARAECSENRILSKKNQALKDEGAGNEIGKDCARAECFENQTPSMKKQAMKDRGSGNEMINDSAREKHYEKQSSQKRRALKDKDLGTDIVYDFSREKHYGNQTHAKTIRGVKDKGEGNDIGKDSYKEEHHENRIDSKKKQAAKHQGTDDEIEKDSVAGEEHQENRITSEEKGVKDKGRKEIEKDSSGEDRCENQILPQKKQTVNAKGAGKQIENDSLRKECSENQILLQKKQAVSDEGVDSLIDTLQKNCDKWMRKLNKKQQQEVHELQQIWEENISELKMDRELELAIIRSLHKKNSAIIADKVKLLDGKFAKKMDEFNLSKEVQLKDLEANHLAAINEEKEKQVGWLARAKPCQSSELKGVCGPESSGSQSEKVCGFPQPSTQDVVPIKMHNVEDKIPCKSVRGNDVTLSEDFVSIDLQNAVHAPWDLSDHSSNTGFDDGDRTGLSGALVNQRNETDETTTGGSSPIFEQMLETLELQASKDEIYQGSSAAVIQDQGAQVVEKQETSLVEEDDSHIDNVEDQVTLQIEVDDDEIVDSVNSLQDEGAQLFEKQNSSDHVDSVTLLPSSIELSSKPSDKRTDLGDTIGFPDALVNPGDETNEATMGCLPLIEQLLEPSKPQVLEDAIPQGSASAVVHYHGAQVVEEQNTSLLNRNASVAEDQVASLIKVANNEVDSVSPVQGEGAQVIEKQYTLENVDTVTTLPSNIDVQDQPIVEEQLALQIEPGYCEPVDTVNPVQYDDALLNYNSDELQIEQGNCEPLDIVNPVQCDNALLIDNSDELHIRSSDETLLCNQPTAIEAENQSHNAERNCLQISQMEETESVPQECSPQSNSNEELQSNTDLLTSSHKTIDFIHQDALQPGSLEHLYGPSYLVPDPKHQVASWKSPPLYAAPFFMELERINAETERLKKSHEDLVSQLSSDCNMEILEMIAQIKKKYKLKHQAAVAEFSSKKNVLEKNHTKVLQSKLLAEILGYTCLGLCSIGLPELHQAPVSSCMQHQPLQHSMSPPPVATNLGEPAPTPLIAGWNMIRPPSVATSSNQPATSMPIPGLNWQAMQHQPLQHLLRPSSLATYPGRPAPGPQLRGSNSQSMQQLLLPSQNFEPSRIQTAQRAAAPGSFGSTSRPPVIGSITPSVGNPHSGGGIHSIPPHLHSSRPATTFPPVTQHLPPLPSFQNMPQVQGRPTGQLSLLDPSVMYPSVGHPHSGGGILSIPPHLHSSRPATTSPSVTLHLPLPPLPAFKNIPQVQGGSTGQSNMLDPSVGHPHSGGGIYSIPPHLHSSSPATTFPPVTQHLPPPPAFQNMPQVQSNLLDPSVMDLLLDVEHLVHAPSEQAYWDRQRLCRAQGYPITSRAVPPDSICISDDD